MASTNKFARKQQDFRVLAEDLERSSSPWPLCKLQLALNNIDETLHVITKEIGTLQRRFSVESQDEGCPPGRLQQLVEEIERLERVRDRLACDRAVFQDGVLQCDEYTHPELDPRLVSFSGQCNDSEAFERNPEPLTGTSSEPQRDVSFVPKDAPVFSLPMDSVRSRDAHEPMNIASEWWKDILDVKRVWKSARDAIKDFWVLGQMAVDQEGVGSFSERCLKGADFTTKGQVLRTQHYLQDALGVWLKLNSAHPDASQTLVPRMLAKSDWARSRLVAHIFDYYYHNPIQQPTLVWHSQELKSCLKTCDERLKRVVHRIQDSSPFPSR